MEFTDFYKKLFTSEDNGDSMRKHKETIKSIIPDRLTKESKEKLGKPLTI